VRKVGIEISRARCVPARGTVEQFEDFESAKARRRRPQIISYASRAKSTQRALRQDSVHRMEFTDALHPLLTRV
jgi:hypothetical protein